MAATLKDGGWAASYLQCFSRCRLKCRRDSPRRGRAVGGRRDGVPVHSGRAGTDSDDDPEEQPVVVKVCHANQFATQ